MRQPACTVLAQKQRAATCASTGMHTTYHQGQCIRTRPSLVGRRRNAGMTTGICPRKNCCTNWPNPRSRLPAKKRVHGEGKWIEQDILSVRQQDYQVIAELSGKFLVQLLCRAAGIKRSSFYSWRKARLSPSGKATRLARSIALFSQYHLKYPSHGYRWLNAKIKLDTGIVNSAPYAHKCCQLAGIKSRGHHYRYKKPGEPERKYPNLLMAGMSITGPLQCVVSDMTAFRVKGVYLRFTWICGTTKL